MYPGPTPTGGVVDWAGFYVGANIGGAWGELNTTDIFGLYGAPAGVFVNDTSGVFGGAQLGYNFQRGSFIIGPEADLGGMGIFAISIREGRLRLFQRQHLPYRYIYSFDRIGIGFERLDGGRRRRMEV
jgi:hypothetical protein